MGSVTLAKPLFSQISPPEKSQSKGKMQTELLT